MFSDHEATGEAQNLSNDVPPIAPMTPRRTPSSYSRHDMITPSPSPWDVPTVTSPVDNKPPEEAEVPKTAELATPDDCPQLVDEANLAYVDLSGPDLLQFREGHRAELVHRPAVAVTASGSSEYSGQCSGYTNCPGYCGLCAGYSNKCSGLTSKCVAYCNNKCSNRSDSSQQNFRCSSTNCCSDTASQPLKTSNKSVPPKSPRLFDLEFRKKSSTSKPLDLEQSIPPSSPSKMLFRRDNKEKNKKSTSEALLQQLNTLTVAAPSSPLFHLKFTNISSNVCINATALTSYGCSQRLSCQSPTVS